jgi:hypothetical protein
MGFDLKPAECEGALGGGEDLIVRTHGVEMAWRKAPDLSQPPQVIQALGEGFGVVQTCQGPPKIAQQKECPAPGELELSNTARRLRE